MKRALAFLMALALVLSLGIGVSAAGTKGSITITNATIDKTYNLYKFFDATYAVDEDGKTKLDANGDPLVSYTIETSNRFFEAMFGKDGTATNAYFIYEAKTGVVTKRTGVTDQDVFNHLSALAADVDPDQSITASSSTVVFSNIDTGYYLIDRGTASAITVTSNVPDVKVIDKNQHPNADDSFSKLVYDEDNDKWVSSSSANVGDIIDWNIEFIATNYDGDDAVLYYSIRDIKSSSLWIEFDSIEITIDDGVNPAKTLTKGYYYCANDTIDTDEWSYLGTGWGDDTDPNNAEWYLIHYSYDEIEIVIPWMDDYTFEGVQDYAKGYKLTFDLSEEDENEILSESIYGSPADVLVSYSAAVGPGAANTTAKNSASLDWVTPEGTFGPEDPETTETKVYNLGITKVANDGTATTAATRLAGAVFELYRDEDCTDPVWVIKTNNEGVYILDDIATDVSGTNRTTSREMYVGYFEEWLAEDPTPDADDTNRRNDVVTPENGQVVIMGLESGTYYLKETKAPEGYNQLPSAIPVEVGTGFTAVFNNNYTDLSGNAVTYNAYNATVENNRGVELPSTGGEGAIMLISIGTMIAIGFAVLLITQKKMSAYRD